VKNKVKNLMYFREIDESEINQWRSSPKSSTTRLFEDFLYSKIKMAEVMVDQIPVKDAGNSKVRSTKQDRIASSFYAWRKKRHTKDAMARFGIEKIILIRRGEKIALKKKKKSENRSSRNKK